MFVLLECVLGGGSAFRLEQLDTRMEGHGVTSCELPFWTVQRLTIHSSVCFSVLHMSRFCTALPSWHCWHHTSFHALRHTVPSIFAGWTGMQSEYSAVAQELVCQRCIDRSETWCASWGEHIFSIKISAWFCPWGEDEGEQTTHHRWQSLCYRKMLRTALLRGWYGNLHRTEQNNLLASPSCFF